MRFALIRLAAVLCAMTAASSQGLAQNMTALGDFPGGLFYSRAKAVSADGLVGNSPAVPPHVPPSPSAAPVGCEELLAIWERLDDAARADLLAVA